jgi:hypothetical protein
MAGQHPKHSGESTTDGTDDTDRGAEKQAVFRGSKCFARILFFFSCR